MSFISDIRILLPMIYAAAKEMFGNLIGLRDKYDGTAKLDGKLVVITGGNTGIGKQTALELSLRGAQVIIACRDMDKGIAAANDISQKNPNANLMVMQLNLASLTSVRQFAQQVCERVPKIDILINNAGVMMCPEWRTDDGFEMQFGTNHLGHFLLTMLLLNHIKMAKPARIITVASTAHMGGKIHFNNIHLINEYTPVKAYNQSKLANVLFSAELSKRLRAYGINNVNTYSLQPGMIRTDLWRHLGPVQRRINNVVSRLFYLNEEKGAQTTIFCALEEGLKKESGQYYDNCRVEYKMVSQATDEENAKQLWQLSCELVSLEEHLRLNVV